MLWLLYERPDAANKLSIKVDLLVTQSQRPHTLQSIIPDAVSVLLKLKAKMPQTLLFIRFLTLTEASTHARAARQHLSALCAGAANPIACVIV